jgi:type IV secretion system protein VirB3
MATAGIPKDILYLACTRPALKFGVPFEGFVVNMCGTLIIGMILGSPLYWVIGIAIHFPMRIITDIDHNFFRIWRLWFGTKGAAIGGDLWGGSALSPLPVGLPRKAKELVSAI